MLRGDHIRRVVDSTILGKRYFARKIDIDNIDLLKKYFSNSNTSVTTENVYKVAYTDFILKYALSNLLKNLYLINELHMLGVYQKISRIIDLGSGPGIFSLADNIWRSQNVNSADRERSIVSIDSSDDFLSLFCGFINELKFFTDTKTRHVLQRKKIRGPIGKSLEGAELIVMSNSLSEMMRDESVDKDLLIRDIRNSGAVIAIIDYPYDNTNYLLRAFSSIMSKEYKSIEYYRWPYWEGGFSNVDLNAVEYKSIDASMNICPNVRFYKSILFPRFKKLDHIMPIESKMTNKYKAAWEHHDIKAIKALFTEQSVYFEKQDEDPMIGLKSICSYWEKNSLDQSEVKFDPRYILLNGHTIECLWKSQFFREDLGKWLRLSGQFRADLQDGRIGTFWEDFEKKIS